MRFLFIALLLTCFATPVFADDLADAEAYLNSITTFKARFTQTAYDGTASSGRFLLKRPGRMKFEYDPPLEDFIVADGTFVYYYDAKMKQASSTLISKSLADFFLRDKLTLTGDIQVSSIKRQKGYMEIVVVQKNDPASGSMTLYFKDQSGLELMGWKVLDAQNLETEVVLSDIETGIKLNNDLFHYYDPEHMQEKLN